MAGVDAVAGVKNDLDVHGCDRELPVVSSHGVRRKHDTPENPSTKGFGGEGIKVHHQFAAVDLELLKELRIHGGHEPQTGCPQRQ